MLPADYNLSVKDPDGIYIMRLLNPFVTCDFKGYIDDRIFFFFIEI